MKKLGLSPDEYFYLRFLKMDKASMINELVQEEKVLDSLADKGLKDLKEAVKLISDHQEIDEFVQKYRTLFPRTTLPSGRSARSTESEVKTKMLWFLANHSYSQEQILEVTERYVEEKMMDGFKYMQTASFFIYKDDVNKVRSSNLAERCEMLEEDEPENFGVDV